ncbi:MAG: mannose-1-phosphate guanylyltransferase/mannose-6-phosphate isomerase, partial [Gammaproteobacteria bacterium]
VLLMMPADHLISDTDRFRTLVAAGYALAVESNMVTFGVKPDKPETGYGYIRTGEIINRPECSARELMGFVEKPDLQTAMQYAESGEYYWNSGIFMMKASVWLQAMETYQPDILRVCKESVTLGNQDGIFFRPDDIVFRSCPSDSIDYAVMEKINTDSGFRGVVLPMDQGWSDIGSWSAVWEEGEKQSDENVAMGDVLLEQCSNSLVVSNGRLVTAVGCKDLIVVETADAVLVVDRNQTQEVKTIVTRLKNANREEAATHRLVHRPWGSYEQVDQGKEFQVKRLTIKPGKRLSLQSHSKRAEHWVVVRGTAVVTRGEDIFTLERNQSTYIPIGEKHRLANEGETMLEIIEVQSGDYLGEDDIVRYDDDFGRLE